MNKNLWKAAFVIIIFMIMAVNNINSQLIYDTKSKCEKKCIYSDYKCKPFKKEFKC